MQQYQTPYQSYLDRPLTARDFERLLNLLILNHQKHQQYQRFSEQFYPFYPPPLYNQFDPRYTAFSRSLPPVAPPNSFYAPYSDQENMYQAQNPIEQQLPFSGSSTQSLRSYNKQPYFNTFNRMSSNQKYSTSDSDEYLPPNVREDLLYRMLMLMIHSDDYDSFRSNPVPLASTIQIASTTTPSPESNSKKQSVRSVQILGEE